MIGTIITAASALGILEHKGWNDRIESRKELFRQAANRAKLLSRPLIVLGDPMGGVTHGYYGGGDVCMDLNGCKGHPRSIAQDASKPWPLATDSAVVFSSCVLEYVPDIQSAYFEMTRVAGSTDNVFIVYVQPWTLTATVYPGARWRIMSAPPFGPLRYQPVR